MMKGIFVFSVLILGTFVTDRIRANEPVEDKSAQCPRQLGNDGARAIKNAESTVEEMKNPESVPEIKSKSK